MAHGRRPQRQHQQRHGRVALLPGLQQGPLKAQGQQQRQRNQRGQQAQVGRVEAPSAGVWAARLWCRPVPHQQAGQQGRSPQQGQRKPGRGPALPSVGVKPVQAVLQQMRQGQQQRHRHQKEKGLKVNGQKGTQVADDEDADVT